MSNQDNTEERVLALEKHLEDLVNNLKATSFQIDQVDEAMIKYEKDILQQELLEDLYAREFSLAMDNGSLIEKIEMCTSELLNLDKSNFKARRLKKESEKWARVSIIDI